MKKEPALVDILSLRKQSNQTASTQNLVFNSLPFDKQVTSIIQSSSPSLSLADLPLVTHAFIFARLDYSNLLY